MYRQNAGPARLGRDATFSLLSLRLRDPTGCLTLVSDRSTAKVLSSLKSGRSAVPDASRDTDY
jgi:hypothetical protein